MSDTEIEAISRLVAAQPRKGRPPGQPGTLNRDIRYICAECKKEGRENLFVREVTFIQLATKKRKRTRRCEWICGDCMIKHPDYDRERYLSSPGLRDIHAEG